MSLQDEHPDELLQRFLVLSNRAQLLTTAEVILRNHRDPDAFANFLDEPLSHRQNPKTLAMEEFEKRERELNDDIRALAEELAFRTVGTELRIDGANTVKQWAGRHFKTLDDLGALAELYESLSKPDRIWTGARPWEGKATAGLEKPT